MTIVIYYYIQDASVEEAYWLGDTGGGCGRQKIVMFLGAWIGNKYRHKPNMTIGFINA